MLVLAMGDGPECTSTYLERGAGTVKREEALPGLAHLRPLVMSGEGRVTDLAILLARGRPARPRTFTCRFRGLG